jgi:hypothetical protein
MIGEGGWRRASSFRPSGGRNGLLLRSLEDFLGGPSSALAVPVGVNQKIEILFLIEKNCSVVNIAALICEQLNGQDI